MAIAALSSSGLRLRGLLRNIGRTTSILLIMILIGAAIAIWSRSRIDALLRVDEGAELTFDLSRIEGDCGTPSVYIVPEPEGATTRYRLLIDFLGGPNRFPMLGGGDTVPVLALPDDRPPGIGVGRGLPESCRHVTIRIGGTFSRYSFEDSFAGVDKVAGTGMAHMQTSAPSDGGFAVDYSKPAEPDETEALFAVTIDGLPDRWQEGSRRVALVNEGKRDLNVFVHEEAGYQFVNEQDALVRPIGVRRAYVDAHLAGTGGTADNTVVVYRRRPTADIELQHDLVGISTIFGIGVSLFVEGVIVLLVSFASAGGNAPAHSAAQHKPTRKPSREAGEDNEQV